MEVARDEEETTHKELVVVELLSVEVVVLLGAAVVEDSV